MAARAPSGPTAGTFSCRSRDFRTARWTISAPVNAGPVAYLILPWRGAEDSPGPLGSCGRAPGGIAADPAPARPPSTNLCRKWQARSRARRWLLTSPRIVCSHTPMHSSLLKVPCVALSCFSLTHAARAARRHRSNLTSAAHLARASPQRHCWRRCPTPYITILISRTQAACSPVHAAAPTQPHGPHGTPGTASSFGRSNVLSCGGRPTQTPPMRAGITVGIAWPATLGLPRRTSAASPTNVIGGRAAC